MKRFSTFSQRPSPQAPWDPSPVQELVMAVSHDKVSSRYDQMAPQSCPFEISKFDVFRKPPFPTSFALLDMTMGKMGNTIYPVFLY